MGLIIIPMLFVLLLFLIPGIFVGMLAVSSYPKKSQGFSHLGMWILIASLVCFVAPVAVSMGTRVHQEALFFRIFGWSIGVAVIGGVASLVTYLITEADVYLAIMAGVVIATGLVPIDFFAFLSPLAVLFHIHWES